MSKFENAQDSLLTSHDGPGLILTLLLKEMSSTSRDSYTRIELPESPASAVSQRNITGIPRNVRDIAADIYNNIQRWNGLHIRGATLVKEIALLKCDNRNIYPSGLEKLSNSLMEVIEAQRIILENLESLSKQLNTLTLLHTSSAPLFISWSIERTALAGNKIFEAYNKEFENKEFITENICHIQSKDKLMFYAANWTHQPFITSEINLCLESLLVETGHRNKT